MGTEAHSGRKRVLLELGGNAALIVHNDWLDLDDAAARTAHALLGSPAVLHQRPARFCATNIFQTFLWKLVEYTAKLVTETRRMRPLRWVR